MPQALLVIAKRPAPGQTKTRLSPPLSTRQASELYECFLRDTLDLARTVPSAVRLIAYTPSEEASYFARLAPDYGLLLQVGSGLGERLDHVLTHCLNHGYCRAVIMDSDSPTLPARIIAQAFDLLKDSDVVLGPSEDGGYYLIGLNQPQPRLLRNVQMSTPHVLCDTLACARQEGLRTALLPTWYDVDTINDLRRLEDELRMTANGLALHTQRFLQTIRGSY